VTTFTTTGPLDVRVQFGAGHITLETSNDGQATATAEALDPTNKHARLMAEQARIELDGDRLVVVVPGRGLRRSSLPVHVRLVVPELSGLSTQTGDVVLTTTGELGDVRVRTGSGQVQIPVARGAVDVKAGDATVDVGTAASVSVTCGNGELRVGSAGDVTLKTGHGRAELRTTSGRVVVKGGAVGLDLREATGGEVVFETGAGSARVGVLEGTTVQLDLTSGMGDVRCNLPLEDSAPTGGAALRLKLRTGMGDLHVDRATADLA
jgi:hypothetical protein